MAEQESAAFGALEYRNIGPHRGGRVVAVAGHPTRAMEFVMGATGGGVWQTKNGGVTWQNISDGFLGTASVGAIAIADADPNIIWAGMGECSIRGNVSHGDGVYRSLDGGKTWQHMGLGETRHIARIRIHPKHPDLVYVAAFGHAFGPNPERGVYRSGDGGKTWELVLFRSEDAGAIDLAMDPTNPRVLYAAIWEARRGAYYLNSGGAGSSLYKSSDGGDTWVELTGKQGLPEGVRGKIGVAVSPANPDRVWAIVEAEEGGVFRSDDGGETWTRTSGNRELRSRAWYYSHIYADPVDPETVYVLNTFFWKSTDGGANWAPVSTQHPDNHDLWLDPRDPNRMINGNDGGANISFDGGHTWSTIYNQPTGEFYHVTTDSRYPYRVYGAQQDNTTLTLPSRSIYGAITAREWYNVGGAESGYIAVRQDNPNIIFAGSSGGGEGGRISRYDHATGQTREVSVWPEKTAGLPAADYKYRYQWTSPILLSPHDDNVLYSAGNRIFRSHNEGESWECISPDLTRNDPSKLGPTGGPITKDHTGVEVYCTVFALAESTVHKGLLWAGSDDGLIHLSRDNGASWQNVTPPADLLPEWALISIIEPSAHDAGTAYVAATRYKLDDLTPYLLKTTDFGKTWSLITGGIPTDEFTRVIRADSERKGLLFAGTEKGVWVSWNDGGEWQRLQLNLPVVPVHDLVIKDGDLVVCTHGRAFWILDDISPLRQHQGESKGATLVAPRDTVRFRVDAFQMIPPGAKPTRPFAVIELPAGFTNHMLKKPEGGRSAAYADAGQNPPTGVLVHFSLPEGDLGEVKLSVLDARGETVKGFSSANKEAEKLEVKAGPNRFVWNMTGAGADTLPDEAYKRGFECAPVAPTGSYRVRLEVGGETHDQPFNLIADPRIAATQADLDAQFKLACQVRDTVGAIHKAVKQSRALREQIEGWVKRCEAVADGKPVGETGTKLVARLKAIEAELIQVNWESTQDTLNFPPKLNAKVAHLADIIGAGDFRPTKPMYELFAELEEEAKGHLGQLQALIEAEVRPFEQAVRAAGIPLISLHTK